MEQNSAHHYLQISFDDLQARILHEMRTKFSYMLGFGDLFITYNPSITFDEKELMKSILEDIWNTFGKIKNWLYDNQLFFIMRTAGLEVPDYSTANMLYETYAKQFFNSFYQNFKEELFKLSHSISELFSMRETVKLNFAMNFFNSFNDIYFMLLNSQHFKDNNIQKQKISFEQIKSELDPELSARAEEKNITLNWEINTTDMNVDPIRYKRALFEIIKNAIMNSPFKKDITILSESASIKGTKYCLCSISDKGTGFPNVENYSLLDYARVGTLDFLQHSSLTSGLGFGLHNVKHWIDLHNGTIELTGSDQGGAVVKIFIPEN